MPKKINAPKKERVVSFEGYCQMLKRFPQYQDISEEEFLKTVKLKWLKKYHPEDLDVDITPKKDEKEEYINEIGVWKDNEELKLSLKKYKEYSKGKEFTEISDKELLKQLIYVEILILRIQKDTEKSSYRGFIELSNQAIILKRQLGLLDEGKKNDVADLIHQMFKKAKVWRDKNRLSYEARCPECSKMLLFKIRTEGYDAIKNPFYHDNILCNQHLWDLYKEGKITKLDIAKVLFADKAIEQEFYISWLERKIFEPAELQLANENSDVINIEPSNNENIIDSNDSELLDSEPTA